MAAGDVADAESICDISATGNPFIIFHFTKFGAVTIVSLPAED